MKLKKIVRWVKIIYSIFFIFIVVILVFFLGVIMLGSLINKNALVDTANMNAISIILGLASLPGLIVQLVSFLTINEKKEYKATTKCPNCKHAVEIRIAEE